MSLSNMEKIVRLDAVRRETIQQKARMQLYQDKLDGVKLVLQELVAEERALLECLVGEKTSETNTVLLPEPVSEMLNRISQQPAPTLAPINNVSYNWPQPATPAVQPPPPVPPGHSTGAPSLSIRSRRK